MRDVTAAGMSIIICEKRTINTVPHIHSRWTRVGSQNGDVNDNRRGNDNIVYADERMAQRY